MTPKDKANELIMKFIPPTRQFDERDGWHNYIDAAKECSLITVNEIISVIENGNPIESQYNYWQLVKQELLKL